MSLINSFLLNIAEFLNKLELIVVMISQHVCNVRDTKFVSDNILGAIIIS